MKFLFRHRWLGSLLIAAASAVLSLFLLGAVDLTILLTAFVLGVILLSYPSLVERRWQARNLPPDTVHVAVDHLRIGNEVELLRIFHLPQVYQLVKNRYALRSGDPASAGLFFYIYLPSTLYETRNVGPETIYRQLAARLKDDLRDTQDLDLIAQRNLPLTLGFRFLPKNTFRYHEFSKIIDIVKKDYYRENTKIRGVLQSRKRMFRLHMPEDSEWRTFQPYQEENVLLYGGISVAHDFRADNARVLTPAAVTDIDAERVEYPERIPFGSLLTYAKKGEISLYGHPEAVDKLYIDRVNVLVHGSEHRREILQQLSRVLKREFDEEDFYPLFNYGQKLRGYLDSGRALSDAVSSHGNFALYYDADRGWTLIQLEPGLELRLQEAYWNSEPRIVNGSVSLTTSRATIITGSADSLLRFQMSTGTPTRGQIFAADEMIESKIRTFAQIFNYKILNSVGSGAEGCLYLAEKNGTRFYLKRPDGQLVIEEIKTIEALQKTGLIPPEIKTYPEDRMSVLPEYPAPPLHSGSLRAVALRILFDFIKRVFEQGFLCLDLTPDHVKMSPNHKKIFLIDFSGYAELNRFTRQPGELLADRKKPEYRTPEEFVKDFRDPEKFQIYLTGLLLYQLSLDSDGLPSALRFLEAGPDEYAKQLAQDLDRVAPSGIPLSFMLGYDPNQRKNFAELQTMMSLSGPQIEEYWKHLDS